jgi:L-alanine-DL-glutamate epimerase-like enolase superfamily enzyme
LKITTLEARSYQYPLQPPFRAAWDPNPRRTFFETIVILGTDEGINGYCGGGAIPDLDLLRHLLVGQEVEPATIWSICETVDYHGGRNWTVEVAARDVLARAAGLPLWKFLGGTVALMVDANQGWRMPGDLTPRWDLPTAEQCLSICDQLGIYWLEEPLDPAQIEDYEKLRARSEVRIAAGEMVRSLGESLRLAAVVDVIQTDVVLAGGIHACRQIAERAHDLSIHWSPHTWSTGYGLLANFHVALAFSTAPYLEYPLDPPAWTPERRDFMFPQPLEIEAGQLVAPSGPGLGIEPDFEQLAQWRVA